MEIKLKKNLTIQEILSLMTLLREIMEIAVAANLERYRSFIDIINFSESKIFQIKDEEILIDFFRDMLINYPYENGELEQILRVTVAEDGFNVMTLEKYKNKTFAEKVDFAYEHIPRVLAAVWLLDFKSFDYVDDELLEIENSNTNKSEEQKLALWFAKQENKFEKIKKKMKDG